MDLKTSQAELRDAYVFGGPGTIISGVIWLVAGIMAMQTNVSTGFTVLFFGGMLIFPLATVAIKFIFRRPSLSKDNPGSMIVIETVFPMIAGLFAAWLMLPHRPDFVFPLAAIAVGTHYFGFRSAYGDPTYWVLGALMSGVGFASIFTGQPSSQVIPLAIAGIEIVFGAWFVWLGMSNNKG